MKAAFVLALSIVTWICPSPDFASDIGWCKTQMQGPATIIEGTMKEGQSLERRISEDLVFRLQAIDGGWQIRVTQPGKSEDFAGAVRIPLRFDYTLEILPWHFRGQLGAPGRQRDFEFLTNSHDYERVSQEREILLWPYSYSEVQVEKAQQFKETVRCGKVQLTILRVAIDEVADVLKEFSFRVEVSLPQ
jgi:hypothetical protein